MQSIWESVTINDLRFKVKSFKKKSALKMTHHLFGESKS